MNNSNPSGLARSGRAVAGLSTRVTRKIGALRASALVLVLSLGIAAPARAAAVTWTANSSTDYNWDNTANWSSGAKPATADDVTFPATMPDPGYLGTPDTITLGTGETANSLIFNNNYTLTGGALSLANAAPPSGSTISVASGRTATINSNLTSAGGLTLANSGELVLGGTNSLGGAVTVSNGTLSAASAGALNGASSVSLSSNGTLEIANVTIGTAVSLGTTGTVRGTGNAFSTGTITVAAGSIVNFQTAADMDVLNLGNAANELTGGDASTQLRVSGPGTVLLGNYTNAVSGNWIVNSGTLATGNTLGALGNAANTITANAGGTFQTRLTSDSTLNNNVILSGGTLSSTGAFQLSLGAGKGVTVNSASHIEVATAHPGKILIAAGQLTGAGNLEKIGPGTLQLSGDNAGFSGNWTVSAGNLEVQSLNALGSGTITVNGGEMIVTNMTFNRPVTVGGTGNGTISGNSGNSTYSGAITVTGNFGVGVRDFHAPANGRTLTISGAISGAGNGTIIGPTGGTGTALFTGVNTAWSGRVIVGTNAIATFPNLAAYPGGANRGVILAGGTANVFGANTTGTATVGVAGLTGYYYNIGNNSAQATDPRFATDLITMDPRVFSRVDNPATDPNFLNMSVTDYPRIPVQGFQVPDNLAMMWKGLLNIPAGEGGDYTFRVKHDDYFSLYVDGQEVFPNAANTPTNRTSSAYTLAAGYHSIAMKFTQGGGGKNLILEYSGPDTAGVFQNLGTAQLKSGSLAPVDLGAVGGGGTLNLYSNAAASSFTLSSGQAFILNSAGIDALTINGTSTLDTSSAAGLLSPTTGELIFNGAINDTAGGGNSMLTIAGPYRTTFNAANGYSGQTQVVGGQLVLNSAAGNSISGNLDINVSNASINANTLNPSVVPNFAIPGNSGGWVANVKLLRPNQISDTAVVNVRNFGVLDLGANSETLYQLNVLQDPTTRQGGTVLGTGTLTITDLDNSTMEAGSIMANIAGGAAGQVFRKETSGTFILGGNNSYRADTTVSAGVLNVRGNSAFGQSVNTVRVSNGAALQFQGNGASTVALMRLTGTGVLNDGVLQNINGNSTINGPISIFSPNSVFQSSAGNLNLNGSIAGDATFAPDVYLTIQGDGDITLRNLPTLGAGSLTKTGGGFLIFNTVSPLSFVPNVAVSGTGGIGFGGTQFLGTVNIPADKAFKFISDPGASTNFNLSGGRVVAGFGLTQAFIARVNSASTSGAITMTADNSTNFDFTAAGRQNISLGAESGIVTYSGTITPGAAGYRLGGGFGTLALTQPLSGNNALAVTGGTVVPANVNTQTGAITVDGGTLRIINNSALGNSANIISLTDGGTLELVQNSLNAGALFGQLGNPLVTGTRQISVGTGGGTLSIPAYSNTNNAFVLSGANPLTGSGTLTKTGYGDLYLMSSSDFSGGLVIAGQGAAVRLRNGGALPNISSIQIEQNGYFIVDNNNGLGSRQFGGAYLANRVNDSATITLRGGDLYLIGRNAATQVENFGETTLGEGQSMIRLEINGTDGAQATFANLVRPVGGGTVRFENNGGTFGSAGNNPRIFFTQVNGAPAATTNMLGGWGFINNNGTFQFAAYDTTAGVGLKNATVTGTGAVSFTPTANQIIDLNAAGTATLSDKSGGAHDMLALRFGNGAAQNLAFTNAADTLYIGSGGILEMNSNQTRTIGSTTIRGNLTAGSSTSFDPQELFFHINQGTTGVESFIVDNFGSVSVVKDMGGTIELRAANTYSGGTYIYGGRINAIVAGSLGTGPVLVKGAALELRAAGTTVDMFSGMTARDQSEIYLQNGGIPYNAAGDRFTIEPGSSISGSTNSINNGLNSLTRVNFFSAGGQVILMPDAIVRTTSAYNGDVMTNMINGLGTNADLYYNQSGGGGQLQYITVGPGTPWKGISSSVGGGWNQGTIYANGNFWLQGLDRLRGNATLNLGVAASLGSYGIINQSGKPISAFVTGLVALNEDTPVRMPNDLTFIVTKDGYLQPNYTNAFGDPAQYGTRARVIVQAGGVLDPGNYTAINPHGENATWGEQYALLSPVNTFATFEAGGRFLINDVSGIGSTTGGATWTMKADSILQLNSNNAFLGAGSDGLINPGQFVYEPGAIVRMEGGRIYKYDQFVNNATNGQRTVLELFNGNKDITDATNPFIVPAIGANAMVPMTLAFGNGGMVTNDANDRTFNERRGKLLLNDGAILAATTQTYFNIAENFEVAPNATITIGSNRIIDGLPKLGTIQLTGPQSNVIPASATVVVSSGAQLSFNATNTWGDTGRIVLTDAVTAFPSPGAVAASPGNGSSLLLNVANFIEVMGSLTGNGAVIANQGNAALAVGYGAGDFTSNVVFKSTNGQNPSLVKIGTGKMVLTGTSDSTGEAAVMQGSAEISGAGSTKFNWRAMEGGTLAINNTASAANNRMNNPAFLIPAGGTFNLIGNDTTPVTESVQTLANSVGNLANVAQVPGFTTLKVTPGAATTTLSINYLENFQSAGTGLQRSSTWLLQSPSIASLPGTYDSAGVYTPNPANTTNGRIMVQAPAFASQNSNGVYFNVGPAGTLVNPSGSSMVPVRPDYLADTNNDGVADGFVTTDGGLLVTGTLSNSSAVVTATNTTGLVVGQFVSGPNVPNGAKIVSIDSPTQFTMSAGLGTTGGGTYGLSFSNANSYLRALAASEYKSSLPDNMTTMTNVKLSGASSISGDTRVATLTMTPGSTLNISGTLPYNSAASRVLVNAGGVFVQTGGAATINGDANTFLQATGGASLYLHAAGDLNLNTMAFSDNAVVKTGAGALNVGPGAFSAFRGSLQIDGGTVTLGANNGMPNVRNQNSFGTSANLFLNGGTLDLGGNSQLLARLDNNNPLPGMGGTLTSATPATVTVTGGGQFSGAVTGAISLDKTGNNTLLLTNDNTYSGSTLVRSGTLLLRDAAKLSGTSAIEVQYATLQLDNSYLSAVNDRLPQAAPVTLKGATLNITGGAGQYVTQTLNTVNLNGGQNNFTSNAGGGGANELRVGNLVRSNGAFANFGQNYGFLGASGNTTTAIRNLITNVNGSPIQLTNNILPAWMIANGDHFATYSPTQGIGYLSNTAEGFANYDSTDATAATATQNVNDGSARTFTVSKTINAWRIAPNAAVTMTFNQGVGLTLQSGGLLTNNNNTTSLNSAANATGMFLTSGTGELDLWVNQNTTGINIPITGDIDFIKSGGGGSLNLNPASTYSGATVVSGSTSIGMNSTAGLAVGQLLSGTGIPTGATITTVNPTNIVISSPATASGTAFTVNLGNTYTGTSYFHNGTITLNMAGANGTTVVAIPGDLVLNNTTVTEANVGNQIKASANVTIAGSSRLNVSPLANAVETLGSITVQDVSGTAGTTNILDRSAAQPTSIINLSAPVAITVNNTNPNTTPYVGGNTGILGFTNASGAGSTLNVNAPTIVNGLAAGGLRIDAQIGSIPTGVAGGGLIKTGSGMVSLNPTSGNLSLTGGSNTSGSNVITVASTAGLVVGQEVTGTGIPNSSYITAITSGTTFTINAGASSSNTAQTFTANVINQFNNPVSPTPVLNIVAGAVRADTSGSLGNNNAITTVQNGAALFGSNSGNQVITGSVTLKAGSTMAATINAFTLGAATTVLANQTVLSLPDPGTVNIAAYDYFVPATNNGNITINGRLTGVAGANINIGGPQITQGLGGGGVITLGNPITSGTGSNDFAGSFTIGPNAILASQTALIAGSTTIRTAGNQLGTATINLSGGRLRIREDVNPLGDTANTNATVSYGNNINLLADSFIDANRQTSGNASANTIAMGVLAVPSGNKTLTLDSGNSYVIKASRLDGPGMLIKGGGSSLTIDTLGTGASTPSFGIAGPSGLAFAGQAAPNINFTPATLGFQNVAINGFWATPASKTFNVAGTFSVNPNPGAISGLLAVTNSTTINAGVFQNDGQVGAAGGAATITASTGFRGAGVYVTRGQQLNLAGNFDNGLLKVAGDNVLALTGAAHTFTTGAEVQSGTLKIAPTAPATSSGNIRVLGSAASAGSPTAAAISAVTGTLDLAAGANSITHTGTITNSGLVKVSTGAVTINGMISGPATAYVPGLLEGLTTAPGGAMQTADTRTPNPGNFGVRLEPRMLQMNVVTQQALTGHIDNDTWVYTGYVKDDDGVFSFAENIDDRTAVWIDGALVLNANNGGTSRVVSTAFSVGQQGVIASAGANLATPKQNFGPGIAIPGYGAGWHLVEIRMNNGNGGSGPIAGNGFNVNYGFGYKNGIAALDGADMIKPIDDGTGNLFITPINAKGDIQVDAAASLAAQGFTQTGKITLAAGTGTSFTASGAGVYDADSLNLTGATGGASFILSDPAASATIQNLFAATGTTLTANITGTLTAVQTTATAGGTAQGASPGSLVKQGPGTMILSGQHAWGGTTPINVAAGTLLATSTAALPATGAVNKAQVQASAILAVRAGSAGSYAAADIDALLGATSGSVFNTNSNFGIEVPTGNTFAYASDVAGVVPAKGFVKLGAGAAELSATNTYTGLTRVAAGTLKVTGSIANSSGVSVANGGAFEAAPAGGTAAAPAAMSIKSLALGAAGTDAAIARITSAVTGGSVLITPSLSIAGSGSQLDVSSNGLVVNYDGSIGGESALRNGQVRQWIKDARATGNWSGASGITSKLINATTAADFAVGYRDSSAISPTGGTFMNQPVDGSAVLVRYTVMGDSNLDGQVNFIDLVAVAQNYNTTGTGVWNTGDFNYDNDVNFIDLVAVAQHYNQALPAAGSIPGASAEFQADWQNALAIVPEPGTLSLLAVGSLLLMRRRTRHAA